MCILARAVRYDSIVTAESPDTLLARLFLHWRISDEDGAILRGDAEAEDERVIRAEHLLAIHAALRTLFPQNRELTYRWMTTRNAAFEHRTPVEVVRHTGLDGLIAVRRYLERSLGS